MGKFDDIDATVWRWSRTRSVPVHRQYREDEVRSFLVVSPDGRESQIWIEADPLAVCVWDFKKDLTRWPSEAADLEARLDEALSMARTKGDHMGPTNAELMKTYAVEAARHGRATEEGDHEVANVAHERLADTYRRVRDRGPAAQLGLRSLLEHPDPSVRSWSGAHALEFAPEEGQRALESLMNEGGLFGFTAEITLKTWRRGDLRFP